MLSFSKYLLKPPTTSQGECYEQPLWSDPSSSQWKSFIHIRLDCRMKQRILYTYSYSFSAFHLFLSSVILKTAGNRLNYFFFLPSESDLGRALHVGIPELSMSNGKNLKISLKRPNNVSVHIFILRINP